MPRDGEMGRAKRGSLAGDLENAFDALDQVEPEEHEVRRWINTLTEARDILRDPRKMAAIKDFRPSGKSEEPIDG